MAAAERGHVTRPLDLIADAVRGTGDHVAVTGATGWLGSVALDLLYRAFGDDAPGHVTAYASRRREVVVADGRKLDALPLSELGSQDPAPTTLLHFAFLTRDKVAALGIDAYTSQNVAITTTVLDAIARHRPRRVVLPSSGVVTSSAGRLTSDLRADPYGALKHLDELAFRTATRDIGGVCVIPRVFSVAGSRMTKPELYALGSMVQMAAAGGPIEVRAQGGPCTGRTAGPTRSSHWPCGRRTRVATSCSTRVGPSSRWASSPRWSLMRTAWTLTSSVAPGTRPSPPSATSATAG